MATPVLPRLVAPGDPRHGVVRLARELAVALGTEVHDEVLRARPTHLHFSERVWGGSPEAAGAMIEELATRAPLSVTLHDVPQPSDGAAFARRVSCYRRVVRAARGVACNSAHEVALLRDHVAPDADPVVIPLPIERAPWPASRPPGDDEVALVGFFYPGKGHAEVIAAVAALCAAGVPAARGLGVTALGCASLGHGADLRRTQSEAAALGVRFTATGYLDEDRLLKRCRAAAVPVAAHRSVSASGSIGSWIAAGRRPLVPDGRYVRELVSLRPDTATPYAPAALGAAIVHALEDPGSTWLDPGASTGPDRGAVAAAYVAWWSTRVRW